MRTIFITLVLCLLIYSTSAQLSVIKRWDYRYGGTNHEIPWGLIKTSDGGFMGYGESNSDSSGDKIDSCRGLLDYYLVKLDTSGHKLWEKTFGGNRSDQLMDVIELSDGYLLGGLSYSDSCADKSQDNTTGMGGMPNYWIIRTDLHGNKIWDKVYGGDTHDVLSRMVVSADGGYLLYGGSLSGISYDKTDSCRGFGDYWVIHIDTAGNKLWDKTYGGSGWEQVRGELIATRDGYLICGTSESGVSTEKSQPNCGSYDYWIIKIDLNGNILWDKTYGSSLNDQFYDAVALPEGGFVLAGSSNGNVSFNKTQPTYGGSDYWIIRIDSVGNIIWDLDLGGVGQERELGSIELISNNTLIMNGISSSNISGTKTENNLGTQNMWAVNIDLNGNVLWDKTIFTDGSDYLGLVTESDDHCFVFLGTGDAGIAGYKSQLQWGSGDYWFIKLCDSLQVVSVSSLDENKFTISPNPFADYFTISSPENSLQVSSYAIYDLNGKLIKQNDFNSEDKSNIIETTSLISGMYFLEIISGTETYKHKLIKM